MSKTVKVRIPVAVDGNGRWVCGTSDNIEGDIHNADSTREYCDMIGIADASIVWITAEVPIPEPVEVEGRVSE